MTIEKSMYQPRTTPADDEHLHERKPGDAIEVTRRGKRPLSQRKCHTVTLTAHQLTRPLPLPKPCCSLAGLCRSP